MKVVIDRVYSKENNSASCVIRLIPETNADITQMEWVMGVGFKPIGIVRAGTTSEFNYAITFENK